MHVKVCVRVCSLRPVKSWCTLSWCSERQGDGASRAWVCERMKREWRQKVKLQLPGGCAMRLEQI